MRALLAALIAIPCLPAASAVAAPWEEQPFHPLDGDRTAACTQAVGADRIAVTHMSDWRRQSVEVLRVTAGGTFVPEASVVLGALDACPSVAVATSGAAVVAAVQSRRDGIVVATREPGHGFAAPVRVHASGRTLRDRVGVAVAPSGAAVVAWKRYPSGGSVRAIRRTPGGAFGAPEKLGSRRGLQSEPVVGIDDAGRATVAWYDLAAGPGEGIAVATAEPGAPFRAPNLLRGSVLGENPALAVGADGGAVLAFASFEGVEIFERTAGAVRFRQAARLPGDGGDLVLALAPGGAAAAAWLTALSGDGWDQRGFVTVTRRAPGDTFQPPEILSSVPSAASGWASSAQPPTFEAIHGSTGAAVGADGSVTVGWLEAPLIAGGDAPVRAAMAAGTVGGGWEGARLLGGPGRSAASLAVLADPPAVVWSDHLSADDPLAEPDSFVITPLRSARLHRASPGVVAAEPPAPALTLRAPQRAGASRPVVVLARCSAACDLRGVAGRTDGFGGTARFAAGELDGPGEVALRLRGTGRLPRGPLQVTVTATAPGGAAAVTERLDLEVLPRTRPGNAHVERRARRAHARGGACVIVCGFP